MNKEARKTATALAYLAPNFIGFVVFLAGPVVFSLVMSFTNWGMQKSVPFAWIGLENFTELLGDVNFWLYFLNTAYFMIGIPFAIAGSLILAIMLSQKLKGITVYRTLFYLPSITSGVALMILWKALYNPETGPINTMLNWFLNTVGLNHVIHAVFGTTVTPPAWLISTKSILGLDVDKIGMVWKQFGLGARDAIIYMGIWTGIGGGNMLLYLAALTNQPQELVEAAQIDGASRWAIFKNVTWPYLAPTTFFITIMSFIGGLQGGFEQARVMTGGGPAGTTMTMTYYIYTQAFDELQLGYASAVAWVLAVIILVVTLINWKFGNKEMYY